MTTFTSIEEMAKVIQLQQQIAELQAEMLKMQAASRRAEEMLKTYAPNTKPALGQKAGKVSEFDGRQDNWADWAPRLKCHVEGIHCGAEDVMEWAAAKSGEIIKDDPKRHNNETRMA